MQKERFVIISYVPTLAVENGFLPQLLLRGLSVTILTDHNLEHASLSDKVEVLSCNVSNPIDVITTIHNNNIKPLAIFSNSDHLQASTSVVAEFYKLPTKSWSACLLAKNKSLMRQKLLDYNLSNIWQYTIQDVNDLNNILCDLDYPLVAKPCCGVASLGVKKIFSQAELVEYYNYFWKNNELSQTAIDHTKNALILEKYVSGDIYSLETLGDSQNLCVLGGFKAKLSEPPYFIETGAKWISSFPRSIQDKLTYSLKKLDINFGSCHTEFSVDDNDNVEIIEINYRSAGDQKEFILNNIYSKQYFNAVIDVYLGKKISPLTARFNASEISYLVAQSEGVITESPDYLSFESIDLNTCFIPIKNRGDAIEITNSNKDYLGIFHVSGTDEQSVHNINNQRQKELNWEIAHA